MILNPIAKCPQKEHKPPGPPLRLRALRGFLLFTFQPAKHRAALLGPQKELEKMMRVSVHIISNSLPVVKIFQTCMSESSLSVFGNRVLATTIA